MSNNSSSSSVSNKGLGLSGFLTIIFVLAKLFNVIDWPWVYVLLPAIISAVLVIGVLFVLLIIAVALAVVD